MRRLAIVSVVMVAALSAGLAACGQEEVNPREESLARGSAYLIARGVVPSVHFALPVGAPDGTPEAGTDPGNTGSPDPGGSGVSVDVEGSFGDLLGGGGVAPPGLGEVGISGGVGGPSVGAGGLPGGPLSGGAGGIAGGPSTGIGGVAGGPGAVTGGGFGGALATSVCGFLGALCDFFAQCIPEAAAAAGQCDVFAGGQCPAMVEQALSQAGGDVPAIPPGAAQVFDCFTDALQGASCGGGGFEALMSFGAALESCDSSALGDLAK